MDLRRLASVVSRVFFAVAFILLAVAVLEKLANLIGYTILGVSSYAPGRLLEFAAVMMVFVVALLLRQIRDQLKGSGA